MALKLRRNLVNLIGKFFTIADCIVRFVRICDLSHDGSPILEIKVHERVYTGIERSGRAQLLAPCLFLAG